MVPRFFIQMLVMGSIVVATACGGRTTVSHRVVNNTGNNLTVFGENELTGDSIKRTVAPLTSAVIAFNESAGKGKWKAEPVSKIVLKWIVSDKGDTCKKQLSGSEAWKLKSTGEKKVPLVYDREYVLEINPSDF